MKLSSGARRLEGFKENLRLGQKGNAVDAWEGVVEWSRRRLRERNWLPGSNCGVKG